VIEPRPSYQVLWPSAYELPRASVSHLTPGEGLAATQNASGRINGPLVAVWYRRRNRAGCADFDMDQPMSKKREGPQDPKPQFAETAAGRVLKAVWLMPESRAGFILPINPRVTNGGGTAKSVIGVGYGLYDSERVLGGPPPPLCEHAPAPIWPRTLLTNSRSLLPLSARGGCPEHHRGPPAPGPAGCR
jgi:hypothetical protein